MTVLQEVDGKGKGSLLTFLHGAGLIGAENPAVTLVGAAVQGAYLHAANLQKADLLGAYGITQDQVESTIGSNETRLPEGLNHPELWSKSLEEQIEQRTNK